MSAVVLSAKREKLQRSSIETRWLPLRSLLPHSFTFYVAPPGRFIEIRSLPALFEK
jgi:hypothetical protein